MKSRDISDYIVECNKNGIDSIEEICLVSKKEIEQIKEYLHLADAKRVRMSLLAAVISSVSNTSPSKRKLQPVINHIDDDSDEAKELRVKICQIIEENGPMNNREIIQAIGKYQEDQKIFRAIKYLGEHNIIKRDSMMDNKIVQGDSWDKR